MFWDQKRISKKNAGFFSLIIILAIFIIIFIIFCSKGYNSLENKIDDIIYKKFEVKKHKNKTLIKSKNKIIKFNWYYLH